MENKITFLIKRMEHVKILVVILVLLFFLTFSIKDNFTNQEKINKVALLFHVGNINVFNKIRKKYPDFFGKEIDLYFTCNIENDKEVLKDMYPKSVVLLCANKGMDIGPFLLMINYLNKNNFKYDYYIKIHTKTDDTWRDNLIEPIYDNLSFFLTNKTKPDEIEMYGSKKYIYDVNFTYNYNYVLEILNRNYTNYANSFLNYCKYKDNTNNCKQQPYFVAGTIFVFNNAYFNLLTEIKDFEYEYSILEQGYFLNYEHTPRKTHSWEYLFGYLIYLNNKNIVKL